MVGHVADLAQKFNCQITMFKLLCKRSHSIINFTPTRRCCIAPSMARFKVSSVSVCYVCSCPAIKGRGHQDAYFGSACYANLLLNYLCALCGQIYSTDIFHSLRDKVPSRQVDWKYVKGSDSSGMSLTIECDSNIVKDRQWGRNPGATNLRIVFRTSGSYPCTRHRCPNPASASIWPNN